MKTTVNIRYNAKRRRPSRLTVEPADRATYRQLATLPGATETEGFVNLPLEPALIRDILDIAPDAVLTDLAQAWYRTRQYAADMSLKIAGSDPDTWRSPANSPWAKLYPYQRVGAAWLGAVQRGILGDEPGLGKTVQAIGANESAKRVLVVTMATIKSHWARHVRTWLGEDVAVAQGSRPERVATIQRGVPWLIINHDMLSTGASGYLEYLRKTPWDSVIIDEAHKFQGPNSQRTQGANKLQSDRLHLLTGTPVWSNPDSIWSLLHLLDEYRFPGYWEFVNEYCETDQGYFGIEILGIKPWKLPRLHALLAPLLLRRKKVDVAPWLPPKVIQRVDWEPTPAQRKAYKRLKRELNLYDETGRSVKDYASAGAAMSDLRMLLNAPEIVGLNYTSPKTDVIADLLDQIDAVQRGSRKAIIFTWHKAYAGYLANAFSLHGTVVVTGGMSDVARDAALERFRTDPDIHILVATMGSAGTGIDVLEASAAIFAEGDYVPVSNTQAEDRLHRIGRTTDVTIYRLQARGTVEEQVWNTADDRADISNEMLAFAEILRRMYREDD